MCCACLLRHCIGLGLFLQQDDGSVESNNAIPLLRQLNELSNQGYGVVAFDDDVVLLQQQAQTDAVAQQAFKAFSESINF